MSSSTLYQTQSIAQVAIDAWREQQKVESQRADATCAWQGDRCCELLVLIFGHRLMAQAVSNADGTVTVEGMTFRHTEGQLLQLRGACPKCQGEDAPDAWLAEPVWSYEFVDEVGLGKQLADFQPSFHNCPAARPAQTAAERLLEALKELIREEQR